MKFFLFLLCCFVNLCLHAQKIYLNTFIGASNYQGDLQNKIFVLKQAKIAVGAGLSYELTDKIVIRSQLTFAYVTADDKLNSKINAGRNLNFTSKIYEGHVAAEYYFQNLYQYSITPYAFAGLAIYHFNPTTKDSAGTKYYLAGLNTEGQGFYKDRKPYNLFQISIPFGGGIRYAVNENIHIGLELGMRKLFTDYLDDVSTTYVDRNLLLNNRGAKAVELAFRGNGTYPPDGSQRGSSKHKDWYYFMGITSSFKIFEIHGEKKPKMISY